MKVRVCDDDPRIAAEWVAEIKCAAPGVFDIAVIENAKDEVSGLIRRKVAVEKGNDPTMSESEFDSTDILVVDYDLVHLDDDGSRTTGEGIARLARTYSNCGSIAVMNQVKGPQFDLGMRGHLDSFADLNLDAGLIGNPALWQPLVPNGKFNPTTWMPLPRICESGRKLAEKLRQNGLGQVLAPILGLSEEAITGLSDTAFGFLDHGSKSSKDLEKVTLQSFLKQSLDKKQFERIADFNDPYHFNFAAFRLIKWLDRAVLRPMDVLIDLPHLIDRLPFLIDESQVDVSNPDAWTNAAQNPKMSLRWEEIEQFRNDQVSAILGKKVFNWFQIFEDDKIEELQEEYFDKERGESNRFFFAEDTSRFVRHGQYTRYRADFHNFGDRRAIEKLDGISYGPQRRMRFGQ